MEGLHKTLKQERDEKEKLVGEKLSIINSLHEALASSEGSLLRKKQEFEGKTLLKFFFIIYF